MRRDRGPRQVQLVLLFSDDGGERDEVRYDSDDVYYIHHVSEEVELVRTGQKPHYQLEREPNNAQRLYQEERVGDVGHFVLFDFGAVGGGVEHLVVLELRQRLEAEDDDRQQDDEHGDDGDDPGGLGALGVFEQQPHFALALVGGKGFLFFLYETFILAEILNTYTYSFFDSELLNHSSFRITFINCPAGEIIRQRRNNNL